MFFFPISPVKGAKQGQVVLIYRWGNEAGTCKSSQARVLWADISNETH